MIVAQAHMSHGQFVKPDNVRNGEDYKKIYVYKKKTKTVMSAKQSKQSKEYFNLR